MADPIYTSAAVLAIDAQGKPVAGAEFAAYAPEDTAFTTPLTVSDPVTGAPINPLKAGANGALPPFTVAGNHPRVILKSGSFSTEVVALQQLVADRVAAAGLDPVTVQAAITAGTTAADAASDAVQAKTDAVAAAGTATTKAAEVAAVIAQAAPLNSRYVYPEGLGTVTKTAVTPTFTDGQTAAWGNFPTFLRVEGAELVAYGDGTGGRNNVQVAGPATAASYRAMISGTVPGKQRVSFATEWFGGADWWAFIDGVPVTVETVMNTDVGVRHIVFETPDENPHEITLITSTVMRAVTWEKSAYLYPPGSS